MLIPLTSELDQWRNESNLIVAQKQPLPNGEEGPTSELQMDADGTDESNLIVAQKQPLPNGEEGPTSESQMDVDGTAAVSTKKARRRTETQWTRPFGCGFGRLFPFCWWK